VPLEPAGGAAVSNDVEEPQELAVEHQRFFPAKEPNKPNEKARESRPAMQGCRKVMVKMVRRAAVISLLVAVCFVSIALQHRISVPSYRIVFRRGWSFLESHGPFPCYGEWGRQNELDGT